MRVRLVAFLVAMLLVPQARAATETPYFAAKVAAGALPPVDARLPEHPRVVDLKAMGREPGKPGGTWHMLMGDQRDLRMVTLYSYARLVGFDTKLKLVADILESFEVQDDEVFTFHLRKGHRWSDGEPFTAEDFRYYWEDVALNTKLYPSGPEMGLTIGGEKPKFEVIDPWTVRYTWASPNPAFLPSLAGPQPLYIYMPAHYLKQFNPRYADKDELAKKVKAAHVKDWSALHERMSRQYRPENPDLPTLEPWRNTTAPPADFFVFERNPYYHRVDEAGRQLPYIDKIAMMLGTTNLIPAKVASGDADLQARYLNFEDYTFLKQAETVNHYRVDLWQQGYGSRAALMPNLNAADLVWRKILRDVQFRRALSLGINRHDINNVLFFGLARESGNTVLPDSPLFKPEYAQAYTNYDPDEANKLLDAAGLDRRDTSGFRLLPDGRRADIIVETAGSDPIETDILELVGDDFSKLGLHLYNHPSSRDAFRQRITSGQVIMSMAQGLDNAVPTRVFEPDALAPTSEAQFQWPLWGLNFESHGQQGEAVDIPEAQQLLDLLKQWRMAKHGDEKQSVWEQMLSINAQQVFTIGILNGTQQPVVVDQDLRNVPEKALFSFEPSSFFGLYMPDTFWYDRKGE
ncbi:ABC transporter substrate-binding protein [Lichenihabitans sp. Uapishka_5]|uniref:ABC transporter substrate-binding protein n=1 Tax=Lichenihabitans sp. Uapishka_5 TaxID=3037302 RepID=UPI0029E7D989|nr:ABC transporter substrate-binding protein [Lichenihabitans sp. Uapishka_5]MDX7950618.1 ABC transporter substrate-binding protein [Lichenihabitans sp. Uapishka_5]